LSSGYSKQIKVTITRERYTPSGTEGMLKVEGVKHDPIFTLEEPWKGNQTDISCVPVATYKCVPHNWEGSKAFNLSRVWRLLDVPKRSGICIHNGSTIKDIEGCILVGTRRGWLDGLPAVLNSKLALDELRDILGENEFILTIKDAQ
jgi:hypothetical protein